MTDTTSHLAEELDDHKKNLNTWIGNVKALPTPDSKKGVHDRFVRDCETLIKDLDSSDDPSMADLVDFENRHNSLEVQHSDLTDTDS